MRRSTAGLAGRRPRSDTSRAATWQTLVSSNLGAGDAFGAVVAISGDGTTIAASATSEDSSTTGINSTPDEAASGAGACYVFTRNADKTWSQQAYIKATTAGLTSFGRPALSYDGNTLAVSATGPTGSTAGRVEVYVRNGAGTWTHQQTVTASNAGIGDAFGNALALSADGNTLAVAASGEDGSGTGINPADNDAAAGAGAAYVFTRSAGVWSQQAYIKASNTGAGDTFGFSLSLSADGNTLAVGAPSEDSGTTGVNSTPDEAVSAAGAAYVFRRVAGVWSQQAYIKASNVTASDNFGARVSLAPFGDVLLVQATNEDGSGTGVNPTIDELASASGAVFAFVFSGGVWSQEAYLKASNTGASDVFGGAAMSDCWLVAGATGEDGSGTGMDPTSNEGASASGAAYLYHRSTNGSWSFEHYVKAPDSVAGITFGRWSALSDCGRLIVVSADSGAAGGAVYVLDRT